MKRLIHTSVSLLLIGALSVPVVFSAQTFEEYQKESNQYCESGDRPWNKNGDSSLVPKIEYKPLSTGDISSFISRYRSDTQIPQSDQQRLRQDLSDSRIGSFSGSKTLEAVRVVYRTSLDRLFACGVVSSRIRTIKDVQDVIKARVKQDPSNILLKLETEAKKLNTTLETYKCNKSQTENKETIIPITNTAAKQYCYYRYYLGYLESNLTDDMGWLKDIEKNIGQWSGTMMPTTMMDWKQEMEKYSGQIQQEIIRAEASLPKALRTYVEMDQSYGVHILLMLIYDDYVKLRDVLSKYLNASSQLYQKANNAQNANQS